MVISGRMPGVLAYNAYAEGSSTVAQRLCQVEGPGTPRGLAETDVRLTFRLPVRRGIWLVTKSLMSVKPLELVTYDTSTESQERYNVPVPAEATTEP